MNRSKTLLFLWALCLEAAAPGAYTIYVVPHTHIDLEWFWTYDKTRVVAIKLLRQALETLKKDPRYTFTQDQMLALKPFWDDLGADDREFLRRAAREGRFEVASGTYVQAENAEPDFESLARQFLLAKPWMESTFQTKIRTVWNIDTFGHTNQMPQLAHGAGLRYFVFMRDAAPRIAGKVKSPFRWQSPDGSRVLAYWLSGMYGVHRKSVSRALHSYIQHNADGNDRILLPWGDDLYEPLETSHEIERYVAAAATEIGVKVREVIFATPSRYFADVEKSGVKLPTYTGEFNPPLGIMDLRGLYGQRPKHKLAERRAEEMLTSAEKFSVLAGLYGRSWPGREFRDAWEKVLFNHSHDGMGGSHIDQVYEDAMSRYRAAIETGRAETAESLYALSRKIDTSAGGDFPFLVFNSLAFRRSEVVRHHALFKSKLRSFRLTDHTGKPAAFRIIAANRFRPASALSMAVIEFLAQDIPALGYRLYRIEPADGEAQAPAWKPAEGEIASPYFKLGVDPATGAITRLFDIRSGKEIFDTRRYGASELALVEESNPDMEGVTRLTGSEIRGSAFRPDAVEQADDALGTRLRISGAFLSGRRVEEIALYHDLPRIDFRVELEGFPGRDGMLTAVFPFREAGQSRWDTHGALIERPDGIFNAHNYVDIRTPEGGAAILNRGTGGHLIEKGVVKLILLRSVTAYQGYYSPLAAERGSHVFSYSLYPHAGDAPGAGVWEQARSFNSSLRAISTDAHRGSLPPVHGFLTVESGNFEVTALKRAEDGGDLILRGYETLGAGGAVRLRAALPVERAWWADLMEKPGQLLSVEEGRVVFQSRPFAYTTLRLRMKARSPI